MKIPVLIELTLQWWKVSPKVTKVKYIVFQIMINAEEKVKGEREEGDWRYKFKWTVRENFNEKEVFDQEPEESEPGSLVTYLREQCPRQRYRKQERTLR